MTAARDSLLLVEMQSKLSLPQPYCREPFQASFTPKINDCRSLAMLFNHVYIIIAMVEQAIGQQMIPFFLFRDVFLIIFFLVLLQLFDVFYTYECYVCFLAASVTFVAAFPSLVCVYCPSPVSTEDRLPPHVCI